MTFFNFSVFIEMFLQQKNKDKEEIRTDNGSFIHDNKSAANPVVCA